MTNGCLNAFRNRNSHPQPSICFFGLLFLLCGSGLFSGSSAQAGQTREPVVAPPQVLNLGVCVEPHRGPPVFVRGNRLLIPVMEQGDGVDLNNDGDLFDRVLHLHDIHSGTRINLGVSIESISRPEERDRFVPFLVSELFEGARDLNGDGDSQDLVIHVVDVVSGTVENLGVACSSGGILSDNRLAFLVSETFHGNQDLNGDLDANDEVVFVYEPLLGSLRNVGFFGRIIGFSEGILAFLVPENGQGRTDLNGDRDFADLVLHYYDVDSSSVTNLGISGLEGAVAEGIVFATVSEYLEGRDLNGDGDAIDIFPFVSNPKTGATRILPVNVSSFGAHGGKIVMNVTEQGVDLDGDGSTTGTVLHLFDAATGEITNLFVTMVGFGTIKLNDHLVAVQTPGPVTTSVAVYDFVTGQVDDLGVPGTILAITDEDLLLLGVQEIGVDLNMDGDFFDQVVFLYDGPRRHLINTGRASEASGPRPQRQLPGPEASDGTAAFMAFEAYQGEDLNGDGDGIDQVAHVYHRVSNQVTNLSLATTTVTVSRTFVAFPVIERSQGAMDLNADSDIDDVLLHLAVLDPGIRLGTVNAARGAIADVLFLNGSSGTSIERIVSYDVLESFALEMRKPPAIPSGGLAPFAVYLWPQDPTALSFRQLPLDLGHSAFPLPITGGSPEPRVIWNNAGRFRHLGSPNRDSEPAPSVFFDRPSGLPVVGRFFIQGLIYDPGSAAEVPASVTNGILAVPVVGG